MTEEPKLSIELIPKPLWGKNLRGDAICWDKIKKKYRQNKCDICSSVIIMHLHEQWEYDDVNHIQKLKALITLCQNCHDVKHWGRTQLVANETKQRFLISHFCKVNNCTKTDFNNHIKIMNKLFLERSKHEWTQDLSLTNKL